MDADDLDREHDRPGAMLRLGSAARKSSRPRLEDDRRAERSPIWTSEAKSRQRRAKRSPIVDERSEVPSETSEAKSRLDERSEVPCSPSLSLNPQSERPAGCRPRVVVGLLPRSTRSPRRHSPQVIRPSCDLTQNRKASGEAAYANHGYQQRLNMRRPPATPWRRSSVGAAPPRRGTRQKQCASHCLRS